MCAYQRCFLSGDIKIGYGETDGGKGTSDQPQYMPGFNMHTKISVQRGQWVHQLPAVGCVQRDTVEEHLNGNLRPIVEDLDGRQRNLETLSEKTSIAGHWSG